MRLCSLQCKSCYDLDFSYGLVNVWKPEVVQIFWVRMQGKCIYFFVEMIEVGVFQGHHHTITNPVPNLLVINHVDPCISFETLIIRWYKASPLLEYKSILDGHADGCGRILFE